MKIGLVVEVRVAGSPITRSIKISEDNWTAFCE